MKWPFDVHHTQATFAVRHMGIATVRGQFDNVNGTVEVEDGKVTAVEAQIEVQSVNTREPNRDAHLRGGDFFLAEEHPNITFKSSRVEHVSGQNYRVVGDIEIRGVRKEITLDAEITPVVKGIRGAESIGISAEGSLDRSEFGVTWNVPLDAGNLLVGEKVKIQVDVEANPPQA